MSGNNAAPPVTVDFNAELKKAVESGDYAPILEMARKTHSMLRDFQAVIHASQVSGRDAPAVAMGLAFLDQLISQSSRQIEDLTQKIDGAGNA
jgi:hypothetical protein